MFSFRRKPKKKVQEDLPWIRTSPSLPELHSQGIPWPSNLVDLSALPPPTPNADLPLPQFKGAAKTSFSSNEGPIFFHKPFWSSPGKSVDNPTTGGSISSLYMSHPPSAFDNRRTSAYNRSRPSQKRARNPTTFNLMVRSLSFLTSSPTFLCLPLSRALFLSSYVFVGVAAACNGRGSSKFQLFISIYRLSAHRVPERHPSSDYSSKPQKSLPLRQQTKKLTWNASSRVIPRGQKEFKPLA